MVTPLLLLAALAAGNGGDPRDLEAKKACAAGQPQRGIELLADYYAESGDVMAIFNQGRCYQQNDMLRPALARFREFLRVAKKMTADVRHQAEGHIEELEGIIDREEQAQRAPPPPAPAAEATPAPLVVAAAPPRRPPSRRLRAAGWVLGGAAVAAAATALVLGLEVRRIDGDLQHLGEGQPPASFDDYQNKLDAGRRAQALQWVGYGTALVAALGSAACFLLAHRGSVALLPDAGPSHAGGAVRVRF